MKRIQRTIALLLATLMMLAMASALAQETIWNEERLNAYLTALAEETKDPWQKAIYQAGAENVSLDKNALTFLLRGFAPNLKSLPKRTEDPEGWLHGFFSNISSHSLEASLTLKDGEPTKNSVTKLKSTVKNAAAKAKQAFGQQTTKTALLDLLFPVPYKDAAAFKKGTISPAFERWISWMGMDESKSLAYSALLYAQTNRQLNLNQGPHALEYSVKATAPDRVLTQGEQAAMADISKIALANAMDSEQLQDRFYQGLLKAASALRKSAQDKQVFSVNVDDLAPGGAGESYASFLQAFTLTDTFDKLESAVRELPDYPALDYPKSGRISGTTSGTKIILKVPKDEYARYIQIRSASSDKLLVDLFIRPGGSATVRAPKGSCYLLIAMGTTWYGEEALFGEDGILSRTDEIDIKSSNYYHTITLGGVTDGNLSSWGASEDIFKK